MYSEHANNGKTNGELVAVPQGKGTSTLDLTKPNDQAILRRAIADWPARFRALTDDVHDRMVKELLVSLDASSAMAMNPESSAQAEAIRTSAVKTLAMLAGMKQKDEHKIMDAILGTGKGGGTTNVQVNTQVNTTDARTVIAQMIAEGKGEDLARLADRNE